jgi:hypothetical protein
VVTGCKSPDGHSCLAPAQQTKNQLERYLLSALGLAQRPRAEKEDKSTCYKK